MSSDSGTTPVRSLSRTLKERRLVRLETSGIGPVKLLDWSQIMESWVADPMTPILPESFAPEPWLLRMRFSRPELPKERGRPPVSWL